MLRFLFACLIAAALPGLAPVAGHAQTAQVTFGALKADPTQPVEVTSDQLNVSQTDGTAVFSGNVVVVQGSMRLAASAVKVVYAQGDQSKIDRLEAEGGVTLTDGTDAAESATAVYTVASGEVVMRGDVLLTQGPSTIAGQALWVDLNTGTGRMEGRVKTVLTPGGN